MICIWPEKRMSVELIPYYYRWNTEDTQLHYCLGWIESVICRLDLRWSIVCKFSSSLNKFWNHGMRLVKSSLTRLNNSDQVFYSQELDRGSMIKRIFWISWRKYMVFYHHAYRRDPKVKCGKEVLPRQCVMRFVFTASRNSRLRVLGDHISGVWIWCMFYCWCVCGDFLRGFGIPGDSPRRFRGEGESPRRAWINTDWRPWNFPWSSFKHGIRDRLSLHPRLPPNNNLIWWLIVKPNLLRFSRMKKIR